MSEIVVIDDLSFTVRRSARRTTVGLTIDRDGELVLSVPSDCPTETARQIASAKRLWIYTKLARLTSCTTQLLPSGSLKERNDP